MLCILVDCNSVSENHIGFSGCLLYGVDEGPCAFDAQCKDNLFCGYKNCPASYGNDDANCCGRNQFKSPNYPNKYFILDEKTWFITSPVESIINLHFNSFQVRLISISKNRSSSTMYILYVHMYESWILSLTDLDFEFSSRLEILNIPGGTLTL